MHGKSPPDQVLLIAQVLVGSDEQVELGLGLPEEIPVGKVGPPQLERGCHQVAGERTPKRRRGAARFAEQSFVSLSSAAKLAA